MTVLDNPRHEAFAQARARGVPIDDAFEDAGYTPDRSHARRLVKRADVAARIAQLRAERAQALDTSPQGLIASLMRLARASEGLNSASGMREARFFLMETARLNAQISLERLVERGRIEREPSQPEENQ
jgi:hypothetical protein